MCRKLKFGSVFEWISLILRVRLDEEFTCLGKLCCVRYLRTNPTLQTRLHNALYTHKKDYYLLTGKLTYLDEV